MSKVDFLQFRIKYWCFKHQKIVYIRLWDLYTATWSTDHEPFYAQGFSLKNARQLVKYVKKKYPAYKYEYQIEIYV